jgi:hypothetical protein
MSSLIDEYTKNKSPEDKKEVERRVREMSGNMSELSALMLVLEEMRQEGKKDGGRIGLKEGLGSFETNDPKKAMKEVIKRFLEKNIETTTVPITENIFLNLAPGVSEVELGGIMKILGGELGFGASKDKGIGFNFKKEFNKGGRVAYQEGTPDRELYETPVTDAIKSVNEKTQDLIMKGTDAFDKYSGIDQITSANFPGAYDAASGKPSDFRHQAASNLLAEALGKGSYTDAILGPISYVSGGIGATGLGAIKEVGDLVSSLIESPKEYKDAFSEFLKDNLSNIKGAFAKPGTTTEELYETLMAGYVPNRTLRPLMLDNTAQIFMQRKKARDDARKKELEDAKKKQENFIKSTRTVTGTTKPGTGGGGGFTPTTTAQNIARTTSRVEDGRVKAYGLAKGGLATMLGE